MLLGTLKTLMLYLHGIKKKYDRPKLHHFESNSNLEKLMHVL